MTFFPFDICRNCRWKSEDDARNDLDDNSSIRHSRHFCRRSYYSSYLYCAASQFGVSRHTGRRQRSRQRSWRTFVHNYRHFIFQCVSDGFFFLSILRLINERICQSYTRAREEQALDGNVKFSLCINCRDDGERRFASVVSAENGAL